ncbi:MAG TPA: hypothetical protein VJR58_08480 [Vineibacter sp.]|nr:hypothetical protein [Vineibacter sp.]
MSESAPAWVASALVSVSAPLVAAAVAAEEAAEAAALAVVAAGKGPDVKASLSGEAREV